MSVRLIFISFVGLEIMFKIKYSALFRSSLHSSSHLINNRDCNSLDHSILMFSSSKT